MLTAFVINPSERTVAVASDSTAVVLLLKPSQGAGWDLWYAFNSETRLPVNLPACFNMAREVTDAADAALGATA